MIVYMAMIEVGFFIRVEPDDRKTSVDRARAQTQIVAAEELCMSLSLRREPAH